MPLRSSWDRQISPGINSYAGRPHRIRRQRGGSTTFNPGDILQQAVTDAVVNGKRYAARQVKRAKRHATRARRKERRVRTQRSGIIKKQEGGGVRKPINHLPVVYQYHQ
ncbi:Hypothetical predicted protein [Paramuricea clavata]|uniref:Uncharacterized protein n=1 Tax=Paramuricea clavata TaxID=317549 RepID=A0A7D9H8Y9_PARCT|nr:Hypothetical predicted protein [Paramuricea clavata]